MIKLLIACLSGFLVSFVATVFVKRFALSHNLIDEPGVLKRKIHKTAVAKMGGLGIFIAFFVVLGFFLMFTPDLTAGRITFMHYLGLFVGGSFLMIGGYLDDRYDLPPNASIIAPLLATASLIVFGINVEKLTNPFGGILYLSALQSGILIFIWLMVVMYTTKFLDGLDGLATSVSSIGMFMIMLLSLTMAYYQPDVALLSAIACSASIGFLFWNFHPASIFLGEGGSTFIGFLLGALAIISGGKLATALLVLGIPLFDVIWIIVRRFKTGGIKQIFKADKKHLHHRLLDLGLNQKQIMYIYVLIASAFGATTIFLQSQQKLIALLLLGAMMIITALLLVTKEHRCE